MNTTDKTPLVKLTNVGKKYPKLTALDSVDMQLSQGEVLGLFGHNGAGKTTMMKLILGVITPSHGNVKVMGMAPDSKEAWHMRAKIGYLPENVSFYEQLTGLEVLSYFAKLKGFDKKHAMALLEQVGVAHAMKRQVKTYSKGMRQRLGLAQAFIGNPALLLLDEPTVGLDPMATADFYKTVDDLKSQGTSVILCSHVLPGVEQHIDRAMILSSGKVLAMGSLEELRQAAALPVTIKVEGLNGSLQGDPKLAKFLVDKNHGDLLTVPEQDKLATLRQLLSYQAIKDVRVDSANLEQVYQFYLSRHLADHVDNKNTAKEPR
ncbi:MULTISPECIES: ABC transporter ATP-binding protein [unclassified Colwellia]|uniref:ABC transporter ATP-binding protein n=1 Tax=unclassified Colwellia TaxID=196834 RepID=UPI0015F64D5C|nr:MULTISPECIES: ABC transporter ATP-binding protein [unclassified Colwellia]MBA6380760.1 ABC transporter ATP-binding protein [Colwellia sp. BRX10-7]MBA6388291.1 ABC transporter ATP-binding protein [Colwellia sp. BRX10-2]MBA6403307.1 ABC transporter ATP-binding protein [Colwellia sp. BRX10-5]MBA6407146.1 ABC transporter ATP-binding protein [Colwellia sp. BRX10-1]